MFYLAFKQEMSSYVRVIGLGLTLMLLLFGPFSHAVVEISAGGMEGLRFGNDNGRELIPQAMGARSDRDAKTQLAEGERQTGVVR